MSRHKRSGLGLGIQIHEVEKREEKIRKGMKNVIVEVSFKTILTYYGHCKLLHIVHKII